MYIVFVIFKMAIKCTKPKVTVDYESEDNSKEDDKTTNSGWADSIAKILRTNKPKGKKTLVLSKAKKLTDLSKSKPVDAGYEIEAQDGEIKREHVEHAGNSENTTVKTVLKKKKELIGVRRKPDILEKDRERTLSKIATKGVVQLFNAVKKQQKDIDVKLKDAGSLEVKRDKVMKNIDKREFLKVLRGDKQTVNEKLKQNQLATNKNAEGEEIWSVLRDDFMMGAKMKDWDKELEDEDVMEIEEQVIESD